MEDYKIDIMIESGPNARSVEINLNPFSLSIFLSFLNSLDFFNFNILCLRQALAETRDDRN